MVKWYFKLITNPKPGLIWKSIRFILHWISLPFKLALIGSIGIYKIMQKSLFSKTRQDNGALVMDIKQNYFKKIWENLPVYSSNTLSFYANRVPYNSFPNASNHNTDHQASRHGIFSFLLSKLKLQSDKINKGTGMLMSGNYLSRGFHYEPTEQQWIYNTQCTSGDMLLGVCMAMLNTKDDILLEKFDTLVEGIIDNDYALLEGQTPYQNDITYDIWNEQLAKHKTPSLIKMKSSRGMWAPGLETAGAQTLTILAVLKLAEKKTGNQRAKQHYNKLIYKYGYGLLGLFPTTYLEFQRGYFNEHNCMNALYILSKLSDNKLGKMFWRVCMTYVWSLSKHWFNPYFTGLMMDAHPGSISEEYRQKCENLLYTEEPRDYGYLQAHTAFDKIEPVPYNHLYEDEYAPEDPQNRKIVVADEKYKIKTGLGFLAHAIMIEKNPEELLAKVDVSNITSDSDEYM